MDYKNEPQQKSYSKVILTPLDRTNSAAEVEDTRTKVKDSMEPILNKMGKTGEDFFRDSQDELFCTIVAELTYDS